MEQGGLELTEVSGVSTLMASLKLASPEVILLDLALASHDVLGSVRLIYRSKPEIPLIVIDDPSEKEIAVASLREGAMDYLLKSHLDPTHVCGISGRGGVGAAKRGGDMRRTTPSAGSDATQMTALDEAGRCVMKIVERAVAEGDGTAMNQTAELDVIYRYAPIGLCVYDRDLRFLRVNDALAKFHNLSAVEHIGRRVEEISPEFGKEIANCLRRVFASGEPILNVEKHRTVPGHPSIEREFLASYYPMRGRRW